MIGDLRLDAAHRYWIGQGELVGVTRALTLAGLIDDAWFTDDARLRGSYVHESCALLDDHRLGSVDPSYAPYVAAYECFLRDARPEWAYVEHKVCDLQQRYAGTLDRAGFLNGKWVVVDLKTGGESAWHAVQTAAYARLVPHGSGLKPARFALYLRSDATYRLVPFTDRSDESVFLAALRVAQFKESHAYRDRRRVA